jgi:hypothetical protein
VHTYESTDSSITSLSFKDSHNLIAGLKNGYYVCFPLDLDFIEENSKILEKESLNKNEIEIIKKIEEKEIKTNQNVEEKKIEEKKEIKTNQKLETKIEEKPKINIEIKEIQETKNTNKLVDLFEKNMENFLKDEKKNGFENEIKENMIKLEKERNNEIKEEVPKDKENIDIDFEPTEFSEFEKSEIMDLLKDTNNDDFNFEDHNIDLNDDTGIDLDNDESLSNIYNEFLKYEKENNN